MNWGWGIALFLTGFIAFMGYLTYKAISIDFDLVADDYYAQELEYETRLNEMRNTAALNDTPRLSLSDSGVTIVFPYAHHSGSTGEVYFYDPVGRGGDRTLAIELNQNGQMHVPAHLLDAHRYQVKMSWENKGMKFFHEQTLDL